jgi:hypothetical protein
MHRPLPENFKKHCGAFLVKNHKGWLVNFKIEIDKAPEKNRSIQLLVLMLG